MIGRDQVISSKGDNRKVNQVTTSPEGEDLLNEGRSAITESKASTQDPEKGVEKPPTVDPSNTAKSLTVDSSKVKGKHDGVTEDNPGSEEFRATTSEDKPGVKHSVPVSPKGKEDDQNSLIVNVNGDPDGRVSVEMPELIAPTHDPETGVEQSLVLDQLDTTQSLTVDLDEVQSEHSGKAEDNAGFKEVGAKTNEYKPDPDVEDSVPLDSEGQERDQNHFTVNLNVDPDGRVSVEMPEVMASPHDLETGVAQPPALDPLDTPAKTEEQEIFLTTGKSAGDKNAASEVGTDKEEADTGNKAAFLKKEDKFATFNSQHLHDQVDLEFANEILVEDGDVGPAKSAVHKCLDRFIAEKITVGREQNPTEGFGPYLFKEDGFIKAWSEYNGLAADEIKKDLAEKIPELENAKSDLSEWIKTIFSEAKKNLYLNACLENIDQHFGDENLKNIPGLEPVKLIFQQVLKEFVKKPEFDEERMVEFVHALLEDDHFVKAFSVLNQYSLSEAKEYLGKKFDDYNGFEKNDMNSWLAEILNDVKLRHDKKSRNMPGDSLLTNELGGAESDIKSISDVLGKIKIKTSIFTGSESDSARKYPKIDEPLVSKPDEDVGLNTQKVSDGKRPPSVFDRTIDFWDKFKENDWLNASEIHSEIDKLFEGYEPDDYAIVELVKLSVHASLDKLLVQRMPNKAGEPGSFTKDFGSFLFRDEDFIKAWDAFLKLPAVKTKKDLQENKIIFNIEKNRLNEWFKNFVAEAKALHKQKEYSDRLKNMLSPVFDKTPEEYSSEFKDEVKDLLVNEIIETQGKPKSGGLFWIQGICKNLRLSIKNNNALKKEIILLAGKDLNLKTEIMESPLAQFESDKKQVVENFMKVLDTELPALFSTNGSLNPDSIRVYKKGG